MGDLKKETELFFAGRSSAAQNFLGCRAYEKGGYIFRVWAPNAVTIRIIGDFNSWRTTSYMGKKDGIWELYIPTAKEGNCYKYLIETESGGLIERCDPYGTCFDDVHRASKIFETANFVWTDGQYMRERASSSAAKKMNIYTADISSWRRVEGSSPLSYIRLAKELVAFARIYGYTHIEIKSETLNSLFAPPHGHGNPHTFMHFVNACHSAGIGVILQFDSTAFFSKDSCLKKFDGTYLYENSVEGAVNSYVFSAIRNAIEVFHIDGFDFAATESRIPSCRAGMLCDFLRNMAPELIGIAEYGSGYRFDRKADFDSFLKDAKAGLAGVIPYISGTIGGEFNEFKLKCLASTFIYGKAAYGTCIEKEISDRESPISSGLSEYVKRLNFVYKKYGFFRGGTESAIIESSPDAFAILKTDDGGNGIAVFNFSDESKSVSVPYGVECTFKPIVSTSDEKYGGPADMPPFISAPDGNGKFAAAFDMPPKTAAVFIPTYEKTERKRTKKASE